MFRVFAISLFAALSVSLVFAQGPPTDDDFRLPILVVPEDPTMPSVYVVGQNRVGVIGEFFRQVTIDSTMLSDLPGALIEIVPKPGDGRYLILNKMIWERTGDVTERTAEQGRPLPILAWTNDASGFLSTDDGADNFFFDVQAYDLQLILFDGTDDQVWLSTAPGDLGETRMYADTAIKLQPAIERLGQDGMGNDLTEAQTWEGLVGNVSGDYELTITVYYQIFE